MNFNRIFDIAGAIVVLAGITVIVSSPRVGTIIKEVTGGFANVLKAATGR